MFKCSGMKNNKDITDISSRVTELQFFAELIKMELEIKLKLKAEKKWRNRLKKQLQNVNTY